MGVGISKGNRAISRGHAHLQEIANTAAAPAAALLSLRRERDACN